jgi:hypothetical protein
MPFLLHVPSGRLSGPTLKPLRCFFGFDAGASSSRGRLGAISVSLWVLGEMVLALKILVMLPKFRGQGQELSFRCSQDFPAAGSDTGSGDDNRTVL